MINIKKCSEAWIMGMLDQGRNQGRG